MPFRDSMVIVPGLTLDRRGAASVDAPLGELLIDLALQLEDTVSDPVDIEHVLAAVVLAARAGDLDRGTPLNDVAGLSGILREHLKTVFLNYGGRLGAED